jgi:hypothetical protein
MFEKLFLEHPRSVGEGYFAHMGMAFSFGGTMLLYGLVCLIHGIFPFLFKSTGSRAITELYRRMTIDRDSRNKPSELEVDAIPGDAKG